MLPELPWQNCLLVSSVLDLLDPLHPLEALPARGDVFLQDQQPRVLPLGGAGSEAFPGQGVRVPDHHLRPAVSHLSPRHGWQ